MKNEIKSFYFAGLSSSLFLFFLSDLGFLTYDATHVPRDGQREEDEEENTIFRRYWWRRVSVSVCSRLRSRLTQTNIFQYQIHHYSMPNPITLHDEPALCQQYITILPPTPYEPHVMSISGS